MNRAYGPIAQSKDIKPIQGWSTKVIMGMMWKGEMKVIYDSPNTFEVKSHLGEVSPR